MHFMCSIRLFKPKDLVHNVVDMLDCCLIRLYRHGFHTHRTNPHHLSKHWATLTRTEKSEIRYFFRLGTSGMTVIETKSNVYLVAARAKGTMDCSASSEHDVITAEPKLGSILRAR
jgi:hypothetical protein